MRTWRDGEIKRLTCCENRQKNWYKNWGVIKHTF